VSNHSDGSPDAQSSGKIVRGIARLDEGPDDEHVSLIHVSSLIAVLLLQAAVAAEAQTESARPPHHVGPNGIDFGAGGTLAIAIGGGVTRSCARPTSRPSE
jgi:hypothetical protein